MLHAGAYHIQYTCLLVCAGKRALKKVQPILGGFNREDYATQRLWTKVGAAL
jgi:protease II